MLEEPDNPLSDDELAAFFKLLRRFCIHELDQWEAWRLETPYGEVFVHVSRKPAQGASPEAYDKLADLAP